ncbi:MAG: family 16 glycoside hydrolase [Polyangiales bacterium]
MRASLFLILGLFACTPQGDPGIPADGFRDDFDRDQLGDVWHNTGGPYELRDGWLHVRGARNKPLWLRRVLPRNVRIEVDVKSMSPEGDIKLEVFGDGTSRAESEAYTATSYVIIFGGWDNSTNLIARMDEHADDRAVGPARRVEMDQVYHLKIERNGDTITAWVDGEELATMDDSDPLEGRGHDHFAFNNWQSDLYFDNLVITPL